MYKPFFAYFAYVSMVPKVFLCHFKHTRCIISNYTKFSLLRTYNFIVILFSLNIFKVNYVSVKITHEKLRKKSRIIQIEGSVHKTDYQKIWHFILTTINVVSNSA